MRLSLRSQVNQLLAGEPFAEVLPRSHERSHKGKWKLQPQAHDHVLREEETEARRFECVLLHPRRIGSA